MLATGVVVLYSQPPNPVLSTAGTATAFALAFPLVTGRFERPPTLVELGLCALGTLACALAGGALAALFSRPFVRSRAVAVLGLTACVVLGVPLDTSPAIATAHALDTDQSAVAAERLVLPVSLIVCFALVASLACVFLWHRRE